MRVGPFGFRLDVEDNRRAVSQSTRPPIHRNDLVRIFVSGLRRVVVRPLEALVRLVVTRCVTAGRERWRVRKGLHPAQPVGLVFGLVLALDREAEQARLKPFLRQIPAQYHDISSGDRLADQTVVALSSAHRAPPQKRHEPSALIVKWPRRDDTFAPSLDAPPQVRSATRLK
jgi:hypothetical protein